ncbi:DDB1- and CUL4-associated factor 12 [Mortierella antarctica]|nr:DDB1- and CUL4-associated factor 12 [Mortierella antarctica]
MTLTTEGYVKLWDRESYIQTSKLKLIHSTETVCLTANSDANLFAVGSQSHISITDPRSSSIVHVAESCDEGRYQEIGPGWLNRDTAYAGGITGISIRNAVYALEYDSTGTQLFTAGGPLQLGLCGAYAGLWS